MLLQDFGFGIRRLWKEPGFTLIALLALALGIGANTAIFSLLNAVALQPLPYRDSGHMVAVWGSSPAQGIPEIQISFTQFRALSEQAGSFAALTAYIEEPMSLQERGDPLSLNGIRITSGFFDVWGVEPILGHRFSVAEDKKGGANVVLLSEGLWRRRYDASRGILGRALQIDGKSYTVVGIMPNVLRFPFSKVDLWVPRPNEIAFLPEPAIEGGSGYLRGAGRLRPGVSLASAGAEAERVSERYAKQFPSNVDVAFRPKLRLMNDQLVGPQRVALLLLLGAVFFVLLIACADVGSLLLAQGLARRREIAIRMAIGASRGDVVRQLLAEGVVLALAGAALGVLLAHWSLRLLIAANPDNLPRLAEVRIDGRVLLFTLAVALAAGVVSSLAPALQTVRSNTKLALAEGGRGTTGGSSGRRRTQAAFVVMEVALALTLLIGASLLLQSFRRLSGIELGFNPKNLMMIQISLPTAKYPDTAHQRVFFEQVLDRVRKLPGIESAGLSDFLPITGTVHAGLAFEGKPAPPINKQPLVWRLMVAPGTFHTFGARLVKGRDFSPEDPPTGPLVAIVNSALVRQFFGSEEALGKHLLMGRRHLPAEIVGIVEDMQEDSLDTRKEPEFFLSTHQARPELSPSTVMEILVRTTLPPVTAAREVRDMVLAVDPEQPITDLQTMEGVISTDVASRRLTTGLLSAFSAVALALCLLGIYGVVAQTVSLRRQEIGVRMALGALPGHVVRAVAKDALTWVVAGLAVGLAAALGLSRLLASQLFEVSPTDPVYFVAAPLVLALVAFLACYLPGRRAVRIEPAITLRTD
ncbi:MAG TPA: ABC transporter permease [Thermoanaerobaculia bacterium]|nr:ABC transporter permease [Thermoanaerobaculia bacterium]